ncbi:MAG: Asp-tRNA(Asn)/Glu-tRNA(Gln) amidotransferase subunit GatA [Candidatus Tectomicrobia bacterium]|uniref:Glutamyl-tRNA(Gln) amidotransferase subunit A n=1 Tax=Tectimicrobiota bacterium TaxID=2528274 RepID=A0A933E9D4_UNCTE|nr:Asp-tRNA(Asn)/Glu-tRNA(Gln) amidotransferase subunit GatA [Candidatus Tectomicrobia bacterium]
MNEIVSLTLQEISGRLRAREISAEEAARAYLDRIAETEGRVHAYLSVLEGEALEAAPAADKRLKAGEPGSPLLGVPVAVKDLLCMQGTRTTCGSRILGGFTAPYDATAVALLKKAGAVILGKLNMDEFAMGSSTERSAYGPTRNPWNLEATPGGSSGGSAAAVAARSAAATLGSDTGGSIRQPAACCGVVGMKPTYGRVSRYGLIAFASSLDQIGPLARTVRDCAIVLTAVSGHDPRDSTSAEEAVPDYAAGLGDGAGGMRIGIPKEYFVEGTDPEVEAAVREAIRVMEGQGARVEEVSLPHTEYALPVYYILAPAEASSNLARYDGVRYGLREEGESEYGPLFGMYAASREAGFGEEVKRRIMLGTYALSSGYYDAYYTKAQRVRTLVSRDFQEAFRKVDVILSATAPTAAFRLGERMADPISMYLSDILTIPCNLAGLPGISVPCGFTSGKLPIGLQFVGRPFGEREVLRVAAAFEGATAHHLALPPL